MATLHAPAIATPASAHVSGVVKAAGITHGTEKNSKLSDSIAVNSPSSKLGRLCRRSPARARRVRNRLGRQSNCNGRRAENALGNRETFDSWDSRTSVSANIHGRFQLTRRTSRKKLRAEARGSEGTCWQRRQQPVIEQHAWLSSVLRGHSGTTPCQPTEGATTVSGSVRILTPALQRRSFTEVELTHSSCHHSRFCCEPESHA